MDPQPHPLLHCFVRMKPTAFQGVLTLWRAAALCHKKWSTPLCSSLLASISNAGRKHFTLRSHPDNCVYLCIFTIHALQMVVSICTNNIASFCEECVLWRVFGFHLTATHNSHNSTSLILLILNFKTWNLQSFNSIGLLPIEILFLKLILIAYANFRMCHVHHVLK